MEGKGGCGAVLVGLVAIALLVWAFAFALIVGSAVVFLGGFLVGGSLIAQAVRGVRRAQEITAMENLVSQIAFECRQDMEIVLVDFDQFLRSRGIGTAHQPMLFDNPAVYNDMRRRIEAVIMKLDVAPDSVMRLTTVAEAEQLRLEVRTILSGS